MLASVLIALLLTELGLATALMVPLHAPKLPVIYTKKRPELGTDKRPIKNQYAALGKDSVSCCSQLMPCCENFADKDDLAFSRSHCGTTRIFTSGRMRCKAKSRNTSTMLSRSPATSRQNVSGQCPWHQLV